MGGWVVGDRALEGGEMGRWEVMLRRVAVLLLRLFVSFVPFLSFFFFFFSR